MALSCTASQASPTGLIGTAFQDERQQGLLQLFIFAARVQGLGCGPCSKAQLQRSLAQLPMVLSCTANQAAQALQAMQRQLWQMPSSAGHLVVS